MHKCEQEHIGRAEPLQRKCEVQMHPRVLLEMQVVLVWAVVISHQAAGDLLSVIPQTLAGASSAAEKEMLRNAIAGNSTGIIV